MILPQDTDEEHVSAELADGVLIVKVPKGGEGQVPTHRDRGVTAISERAPRGALGRLSHTWPLRAAKSCRSVRRVGRVPTRHAQW
ncbi:Hsp20/alpha crystallin family protein [Streptomyces echinatus]|uniref:Hsp20/alpha crystallin family protein n=1 Tax=Streptomyces echinatus TaxID=67293 RepID=UPI0037878D67